MSGKKSRKEKYTLRPFESTGARGDTSANIYMSMLMSPAWQALTKEQQVLYLYCKAQYYGEKRPQDEEQHRFTMNQGKWGSLYGIYKVSNAKGFYRDMAALIEHGFVICAECGAISRTKSVYALSDMWRKYGNSDFVVAASQKTLAMNRATSK